MVKPIILKVIKHIKLKVSIEQSKLVIKQLVWLLVVIHTILKELERIEPKVIERIRPRGPQLRSLIRHIRLVVIKRIVLFKLAIKHIVPIVLIVLVIRRIIPIVLVIIRTKLIRPPIKVSGQFIFQQPNILLFPKLSLMGCIRRICLRILEVRIRFNIQQRSNLLLFFLLERIQFLKKFKKYKYL